MVQKRSVKVVRWSGTEETEISPLCVLRIYRERLNPIPEPSGLVVKKGTNTLSRASSCMPGPVFAGVGAGGFFDNGEYLLHRRTHPDKTVAHNFSFCQGLSAKAGYRIVRTTLSAAITALTQD